MDLPVNEYYRKEYILKLVLMSWYPFVDSESPGLVISGC